MSWTLILEPVPALSQPFTSDDDVNAAQGGRKE